MAAAIIQLDDTRVAKIESDRDDVETRASALVITSNEEMVAAGEFLNGVINPMQKAIHDSCDPGCKQSNELHKTLTAQRKGFLDPLHAAERITKGKISDWMGKEEARIAEEKRLIEEENGRVAAKAAAAQAKKDAADAKERQRLADEAAEEQRLANAALEEEKLANATNLEEAGRPVEAERVLNEPLPVAPVLAPPASLPLPPQPPAPIKKVAQTKVQGISRAKTWKAELINGDIKALCREIGEGRVPITAVKLDQGALDRWVKALAGQVEVSCIRPYEQGSISGRR